ncbi:MAG TPA: PP2C family protein-serine/threonine phosphatase [Pyrinomonadaceae bacterium]|nr:PP2C family protein-serine/threonine phosphatase [Pyrinomonadaceae bacterium]
MSAARLPTRQAVDIRSHRRPSATARRQELELKLTDLQQHYAELRTEIFEAAQVHRRLCAPRQLRFGNFEVASEIFAVRHLPGDFFTVQQQFDGVVFALGDICGKGLAAGMWTTHLVGLLGARMAVNTTLEGIVAGVNRDICLLKSFMPLVSLFIAKLDPNTGLVKYCSAGHPPAFLLRANGELELLSDGGMVLGVVAAAPYVCGSFVLGEGDMLMVYSDGITESQNVAGEEFGYGRLEDQLRRAAGGAGDKRAEVAGDSRVETETPGPQARTADGVLFSVLGAVQDFAAACPLVDDMSLAVICRQPAEQATA